MWFKKYAFNTAWLLVEKVLRLISAFFLGIWVARYLGPDKYGIYSFSLSFSILLGALSSLGIDNLIVKNIAIDLSSESDVVGSSLVLRSGGLILSLGIVLVLRQMGFLTNETYSCVLLFVIGTSTLNVSRAFEFYFQAKVISKYSVISNVVAVIVSIAVKLVLLYYKASIDWFVYSYIFEVVIIACFYYYFYGQVLKKNLSYSKLMMKKLLIDGWPLLLSSVGVFLYLKIDQLMLKLLLSNNAVGQYAAAARISEAWYFIPALICNSLFPAILKVRERSRSEYNKRLSELYSLLIFGGGVVAVFGVLLGKKLMLSLYGNEFSFASEILGVHIWTGIFISMTYVKGKWIMAEGFYKTQMYVTVLGAIMNVVLNFLLIPAYQGIGAAIATLITQFVIAYFINLFIPDFKGHNKIIYNALNPLILRKVKNSGH